MLRFLSPIRVEHIDGRKWRLLDNFTYRLEDHDVSEYVLVRAGFVTDFASVPRFFWRLFPPTGQYSPAALAHDWLYQHPYVLSHQPPRRIEREEADAIFRDAMQVLGVGWWTRTLMHRAVRLFAGDTWDRYRAARTEDAA